MTKPEIDVEKWIDANSYSEYSILPDSRAISEGSVRTLAQQFQSALKAKEDEIANCQSGWSGAIARIGSQSAEIDTLKAEIARLGALVPKWIPVTEQLPEFGKEVLWFDPKYGIDIAETDIDDDTGRLSVGGAHWMPLPTTPNAKADE